MEAHTKPLSGRAASLEQDLKPSSYVSDSGVSEKSWTNEAKPRNMGLRRLWKLALLLFVITQVIPVRDTPLRLFILLDFAAFLVLTLIVFWSNRIVRSFVLCLVASGIVLMISPGHASNAQQLRADYCSRLRAYRGSKYIWGGETRCGIDCSGLVRIGLIDADLERGVKSWNSHLIREGLSLWWHDCGAVQLKEGYRNNSFPLFKTSDLNTVNYDQMLSGDFAVSDDGSHTLAYLGNRTWSEADPLADGVIQVTVPSKRFTYNRPMVIMRWRQLAN